MTEHANTKRPTGWLSRLSVAKKIGLGFGIVLVLHLSIVVLGDYGLQKAERDRETLEALRAQVEAYYQLDRVVGELQRNVLLFAFSGYEGPEARVAQLQAELEQLLDEAADSTGTTRVNVDRELIEAMHRSLGAHREIFASVVVDRAKRRSLVDNDLVRYDGAFAAAIDDLGKPARRDEWLLAAQEAFGRAQLHAMRFVNNPDSTLVRRAKQSLNKTRRSLERARTSSGFDVDELRESVDGFETAFIQMVQATRGYLHLVNVVLAGESVEFLRHAKVARNECSLRARNLAAEIESDSHGFRWASNAFSVVTIVLGLVASWLIARDVAPPLNAITDTIGRLAAGEACRSVPGLGRADEVGRLAHAAEVFRAKAAETERLLDEVTQMKDRERQMAHSQKMESIGQLASGIAHEINTPMQCVAGNVEFLSTASNELLETLEAVCAEIDSADFRLPESLETLRALVTEDDFQRASTQMSGAIDDTGAAAQRVVEIVRAMKAMAHPGEVDLVSTDVNQVIRDAVTISRNRWKYVAELTLDLDENLPHPQASPASLSQVVLNLIVNAADAIAEKHEGGGEIGAIHVQTYCDAESVYLEVEDSGVGVPEAIRHKLFDPFFTTKEVGKGTGQGLSVCYDTVVRRLGGDLRVESEPGAGSTFTVQLPINVKCDLADDAESNVSRRLLEAATSPADGLS